MAVFALLLQFSHLPYAFLHMCVVMFCLSSRFKCLYIQPLTVGAGLVLFLIIINYNLMAGHCQGEVENSTPSEGKG